MANSDNKVATVTASEDAVFSTGRFSLPGAPVDSSFFRQVFRDRLKKDKTLRRAYYENILMGGSIGMNTFFDLYGGVDYFCETDYTNLEYTPSDYRVKISNTKTISANSSETLNIDISSTYVDGTLILPQEGNVLVAPPNGALLVVTGINVSSGDPGSGSGDSNFTISVNNISGDSAVINAEDKLLVLMGSELSDCACPTGQFTAPDLPQEIDLSMKRIASKGELCGKDLLECHPWQINFINESTGQIDSTYAYTQAEQRMYKEHEARKYFQVMLDPDFGIVPNVLAKGLHFSPANPDKLEISDFRDFVQGLDKLGIRNRDFAVFGGGAFYSKAMQLREELGNATLSYSERPLNDCPFFNLDYCGLQIEGVRWHFYKEDNFSNGTLLGGPGYSFPNSAIFVPLSDRSNEVRLRPNRISNSSKQFVTVFFESQQGKRFDSLIDSNGELGPRNSFGVGCHKHEWSVESWFTVETFGVHGWGWTGFDN